MAMGARTDAGVQSAGITLLRGDLRGNAKAIRLSRATTRNIRRNLIFAFGFDAHAAIEAHNVGGPGFAAFVRLGVVGCLGLSDASG
jgi:P-type Cu+ transporter